MKARIFFINDTKGVKHAVRELKKEFNAIQAGNKTFKSADLNESRITMIYTIKEINRRLEVETNAGKLYFINE